MAINKFNTYNMTLKQDYFINVIVIHIVTKLLI